MREFNTKPVIKKGMTLQFVDQENKLVTTRVVSRAGKATGKYGCCWNTEDPDTSTLSEVDFSKISGWTVLPDEVENENDSLSDDYDNAAENICLSYDLSHTFIAEINSEVEEAKQVELRNWITEKVYVEVEEDKQKEGCVYKMGCNS